VVESDAAGSANAEENAAAGSTDETKEESAEKSA